MNTNRPKWFEPLSEIANNGQFTLLSATSRYMLFFVLNNNSYEITIPKDNSSAKITIWPEIDRQIAGIMSTGYGESFGQRFHLRHHTSHIFPSEVISFLANPSNKPLEIPDELADLIIAKIPGLALAIDQIKINETAFVEAVKALGGPLVAEIPRPTFI